LTWDAIVIGAGHNGLVAAAYLAKAGMKTLVVESRDVVGGAAVTEELLPGFWVSTASYSLSLLRPDVYSELDLAGHGLSFYPKDPQMFVPLPDGRSFFIWRDERRTLDEIRRIHPADAHGYLAFGRFWEKAVSVLRPFAESLDPPKLDELHDELLGRGLDDVWRLAVEGSAAEAVEEFFESEELQGAFVGQGIIGTALGPRQPGTAWVMAYHFLGGELNGSTGTWAYVRGGMGGVSGALAAAARNSGAEIRLNSPVEQVILGPQGAEGVILSSGEELRSRFVLSNADPITTFSRLVDPGAIDDPRFRAKVDGWKSPGSVVKVNLALDRLPNFRSRPGDGGPQHRGTIEVSPSIDYVEAAWQASLAGSYPKRPFMEVFIQSATDDSLAPPGKHVLSAFSQWAPSSVSSNDSLRADALAAVLETLDELAPGCSSSVLAAQTLVPADIEARFGMTGGNIFHGEIIPEQSFGERFGYRTPVKGLYLCGSGASPGGGVMGAAGRNCAKRLLEDRAL